MWRSLLLFRSSDPRPSLEQLQGGVLAGGVDGLALSKGAAKSAPA